MHAPEARCGATRKQKYLQLFAAPSCGDMALRSQHGPSIADRHDGSLENTGCSSLNGTTGRRIRLTRASPHGFAAGCEGIAHGGSDLPGINVMLSNQCGDLLVFSHLRWEWVFQRPQHLMMRAARDRRVFFFEEPMLGAVAPSLCHRHAAPNVTIVTPHLPDGMSAAESLAAQRALLDSWMVRSRVHPETLWYYTPVALNFTAHLSAPTIVYDCMDELAAFAGAPPELRALERQLMARADVVFTGGVSLYEAKRSMHSNVHAMPSCVDLDHFRAARAQQDDHARQSHVPQPRIGFCGVLDERLDIPLISELTQANPAWQFVFAGPVCKIDPASLPTGPNVHYLGACAYDELPSLMSHWQVGWMPFAINEATRYISPTKTPEYLAAGLPVVSSPIRDVVRTWGDDGFVTIAATPQEFSAALTEQLSARSAPARLARIDRTLAFHSWDALWYRMDDLMRKTSVNAA